VVRLETHLPAQDLRARVDANQIHQILLNLCTNAWHALRGSTGVVAVGLERIAIDENSTLGIGELAPGPHVHLWVSDNGCGMDAATRARIFEPFFTTKPRGEGTGLGLAVVHGIVRSHGGAIAVESEPGTGTRFNIYLPEALTAPELASPVDAKPMAGLEGRRVAYVDDDEVMRLMVERLLRRRGFEVECHADPAQLLARLHERPGDLDIVVSDFNMPGMTGLELASSLAGSLAGVPVIVSSGYISEELRAGADQAGVTALLEKEDTLERLVPLIARVLTDRSGGATPLPPRATHARARAPRRRAR
jgi:CheY-like chemotaxis protein